MAPTKVTISTEETTCTACGAYVALTPPDEFEGVVAGLTEAERELRLFLIDDNGRRMRLAPDHGGNFTCPACGTHNLGPQRVALN